jgi:hypothetical protein
MLVIAGPHQGVAGERPGVLVEVVEDLLQVVQLLSLFAVSPSLEVPLIPLDGLHPGDQQGGPAAGHVFGCDSTAPPDGVLQARPTVAVNQGQGYYAPLIAPNPLRNRRNALFPS